MCSIPVYKVVTVHFLYPFVAVLWVPGTVHVTGIQWKPLLGRIPCTSYSSHCHGIHIQEEIWTQLSVRCARELFALSADQFTQHWREKFISQQQIGNDSFYRSTSLKRGWELQWPSLFNPKPLMPRKVCASLKTLKHRKPHSKKWMPGFVLPIIPPLRKTSRGSLS